MSVNDEDRLPWLKREKRFIREVVLRQTPYVGICLGAQLLANAFGARVYPNSEREIGWFPVWPAAARGSLLPLAAPTAVFHWHGETFDLPEGAVHLARSEACAHQAFQLGRRALGLQFHLETTPASAEALIDNCRGELTGGGHVQTEEALRSTPEEHYLRINGLMEEVLTGLTAHPGAGA